MAAALFPLLALLPGYGLLLLQRIQLPGRGARLVAALVATLFLGIQVAGTFAPQRVPLLTSGWGLKDFDERCYQDWLRGPRPDPLGHREVLAEIPDGASVLVAAEPEIPCRWQTTFSWSFHLAYRARLWGRDLTVSSWEHDPGSAARALSDSVAPSWLVSSIEPRCENNVAVGRWATWLDSALTAELRAVADDWSCADWRRVATVEEASEPAVKVHVFHRSSP